MTIASLGSVGRVQALLFEFESFQHLGGQCVRHHRQLCQGTQEDVHAQASREVIPDHAYSSEGERHGAFTARGCDTRRSGRRGAAHPVGQEPEAKRRVLVAIAADRSGRARMSGWGGEEVSVAGSPERVLPVGRRSSE